MTLVAFNGRLGSGKDTAGERLAAMAGVETQRLSFARLLKESAAALFGIPVEDWETYKNDPDVKIMLTVGYEDFILDDGTVLEQPRVVVELTAREFLQRYGTESHRDIFGADFWVNQALIEYVNAPVRDTLFYVTDCRFANEATAVHRLGGVVVNVIGADEDTGEHLSEAPLPDSLINFYIDNTTRGDDFAMLDRQLRSVAATVGIPLR
jgi:hypothetical protein